MDDAGFFPLEPGALESGGVYAGVVLRDCELTDRGLEGVSFEGSLLTKVRGAGIELPNLQLSDAEVRGCDFANAVWHKARLNGTKLANSRLTGWNVAEGVLRTVRFTGCKIDLAVFHNAVLSDCLFHDCDLRESDFQAAKLKGVTFRDCDLRGARYPAATLSAVDFRGSHLAGIYLDAESLRDNLFTSTQLPHLAALLGIVVRELGGREPSSRNPP